MIADNKKSIVIKIVVARRVLVAHAINAGSDLMTAIIGAMKEIAQLADLDWMRRVQLLKNR